MSALKPFDQKTCPKCGQGMKPRLCGAHYMPPTDGPQCGITEDHLHWLCPCGYGGNTITATADAKGEQKARYFTTTNELGGFIEWNEGGCTYRYSRYGLMLDSKTLARLERDVRRGIRRELTEDEALALLHPAPLDLEAVKAKVVEFVRDLDYLKEDAPPERRIAIRACIRKIEAAFAELSGGGK